jgi:phage FluMu protein Com
MNRTIGIGMRAVAAGERPAPRSASCGGDSDVRCACGSLLARIVTGAVELKCRRCKQTWRIPFVKDEASNTEASGPAPRAQRERDARSR